MEKTETLPNPFAQPPTRPFNKRFVRKAVDIRVEVERFSEALASSSVNISPSGICFLLDEPLEHAESMRLLLYVPHGKEVEILKVKGRVVWQEDDQQTEGKFRIGAAFDQFAPGDERRLRGWLLDLPR